MSVIENEPQGEPTPQQDPNSITIPVQEPPPEPPTSGNRNQRSGADVQQFTAEDVERIRQEERARVTAEQTRADQLENELATFRKAQEDRDKADQQAAKAAERAAKKKEEEDMEVRTLLERKEQEWQTKLDEERAERERAFAMLEQERRHASLQTYLAQRMALEGDEIAPELRDLVSGNTEQEIDSSINLLKEKSAAILGNYQQVVRNQNATRPTVGVTSPPVGPDVSSQTTRTYTADELKAMTPEEYSAQRDSLLRAASQSRRQQ